MSRSSVCFRDLCLSPSKFKTQIVRLLNWHQDAVSVLRLKVTVFRMQLPTSAGQSWVCPKPGGLTEEPRDPNLEVASTRVPYYEQVAAMSSLPKSWKTGGKTSQPRSIWVSKAPVGTSGKPRPPQWCWWRSWDKADGGEENIGWWISPCEGKRWRRKFLK